MVLIIHHWDTDGIASTAIIARILENNGTSWENVTPKLGVYSFDEVIMNIVTQHDEVYILDLNVPKKEVLKLKDLCKRIIFIDHHKGQEPILESRIMYVNPITFGESERTFPSTTWVISDMYSEWSYLSALGALGDLGIKKIRRYCLENRIKELFWEAMLDIEDARKLIRLLDSNSIVGDRDGVIKAVTELLNKSPRELLKNPKWNSYLHAVEQEIDKAMDNVEEEDGVAVVTFESTYDIVSKVARALVWDLGYKAAIVANLNPINGIYKVYIRISPEITSKVALSNILDELRRKGIQSGGKADVLGINAKNVEEALYVVDLIRRSLKCLKI